MATRYTIRVTRDDLERASRGVSTTCAVAQAIMRQLPGSNHLIVDTQTIRFTLDKDRLVFLTPMTVQQYVSDFDAGLPIGDTNIPGEQVGPFSFGIRKPIRLARRVGKAADGPRREVKPIASGPDDKTAWKVGRKVFRTTKRSYGSRVLRWNAEAADK